MARNKYKKNKPIAKKSLGQNFLIDQNYINKIIGALNPNKSETIIEIGPGRGALTKILIERSRKVLAIEIDRDLIPILNEEFQDKDNFRLIENDALEIDFKNLLALQSPTEKTKLVANLPYYISTAILQHLIQYRESFAEIILMLQKEVVERITADIGTKERGFLTVLIEAYFGSEKLFDVPPNAFFPVPKVMSSVLRLERKKENKINIKDDKLFREIISLSFNQKRKTIQNNLKNAQAELLEKFENCGGISKMLEISGIETIRRAENIELSEWIRLENLITEKNQDD